MKKITKTVYEVSELSKDAFERAYLRWRGEAADIDLVVSMLNDECNELLKARGVTWREGAPHCLFSLSSSRGDGLMFEGKFRWKGYSVTVRHSGRHYHSRSKSVDIRKEVNGCDVEVSGEEYASFDALYTDVCVALERSGYQMIEDMESEAAFIDESNANEWHYTEDGIMDNDGDDVIPNR